MSGMPREHPMLFSGPMVRALLRDVASKTVTRRLINSRSAYFGSASRTFWDHASLDLAWVDGKGSTEEYLHVPCHRGDEAELDRLDRHWAAKGQPNSYREQYPDCGPCEVCDHWGWRMTAHRLWCRIKPGDRIWVRETWGEVDHWQGSPPLIERIRPTGEPQQIIYQADCPEFEWTDGDGSRDYRKDGYLRSAWTPSIHMPRWASRLTLEVLSVKAERLQDTTEEDAIREGMVYTEHPPAPGGTMSLDGGKTFYPFEVPRSGWAAEPNAPPDHVFRSARLAFANLWDKINGKCATWESNPRVWRYELRRVP